MLAVKIFYLEETPKSKVYLRRYSSKTPCPLMAGSYSYHNAMTFIGENMITTASSDLHAHDDPRWPTHCGCGYAFQPDDTWQRFSERLYRRYDTAQEMTLKESPPGACWNAAWMIERGVKGFDAGEDGRCLVVKLPGGHEWHIDARANNCTLPKDDTHKCWPRKGSPEDGTLDVRKHHGPTCSAGSGSIVVPGYHGFCHHGFLVPC